MSTRTKQTLTYVCPYIYKYIYIYDYVELYIHMYRIRNMINHSSSVLLYRRVYIFYDIKIFSQIMKWVAMNDDDKVDYDIQL